MLAAPVVLWAGRPFFARAVASVAQRSPNMWTLIGLGTGAAFAFSVVATVAPGLFPDAFLSMGRAAGLLRSRGRDRLADAARPAARALGALATWAAIRSLLELAPKTARRIRADGSEEDVRSSTST